MADDRYAVAVAGSMGFLHFGRVLEENQDHTIVLEHPMLISEEPGEVQGADGMRAFERQLHPLAQTLLIPRMVFAPPWSFVKDERLEAAHHRFVEKATSGLIVR